MRAIRVFGVILLAAPMAVAQTKVSGTVQCSKPDRQESMDVGDRPNHSLTITQGKCTWTQPLEIEGAKTKEGAFTAAGDVGGKNLRLQGYAVETLDSGDKYTVRIQGTQNLQDGKPVSERGNWAFLNGTGKLKGIKGKGTFEGKAEGDNMVVTVEGEYTLAK
jgi:hypothetical protein